MNRLALLSASALVAAGGLAACGITQPSQPGQIPAQVLTDVNGALVQLDNILPALAATDPPVIPPATEKALLQDVNYAFQALSTVGSSTQAQTGATALARAEGYGGAVLTALLNVPLPQKYDVAVVAANIVWGSFEIYVNGLVAQSGGPAPPASPAKARAAGHRPMSLEEARSILKIPTTP